MIDMPKGVYKRKHGVVYANQGKHHSEESKQKMSKAKHGNTNRLGKKHTEETKQKLSAIHTGRKLSIETRQKMSANSAKPMLGKLVTKETRNKLRESHLGKNQTEKTKLKLRKLAINRIEKQKTNGLPITPCIGKHETEILDVLEETIGYTIFRQYKVNGYFLDGYCPNYNLAIEIDEKHHNNQKEKDLIRENNIKKELNCEFVRLDIGV